jgi:hypothetical protein
MKTRLIRCLLAVVALSFSLAADPISQPVELKVTVLRYSAERRGIVVRFENHSSKPLRLLRPIDGSEWGWHMPIYDVSVTDSTGKAVPLGSRCGMSGLYSNLKWPDDYRIQILPGDAYEMAVDMAREYPLTGSFTVSFRYTFDMSTKTPRPDPSIKYPDDLWVGSATSAPVQIEIAKQP